MIEFPLKSESFNKKLTSRSSIQVKYRIKQVVRGKCQVNLLVYVSLWRVACDCVTRWLIQRDDLTVWRVWSCDELTVTSWLFDELVMWRVDWQPSKVNLFYLFLCFIQLFLMLHGDQPGLSAIYHTRCTYIRILCLVSCSEKSLQSV